MSTYDYYIKKRNKAKVLFITGFITLGVCGLFALAQQLPSLLSPSTSSFLSIIMTVLEIYSGVSIPLGLIFYFVFKNKARNAPIDSSYSSYNAAPAPKAGPKQSITTSDKNKLEEQYGKYRTGKAMRSAAPPLIAVGIVVTTIFIIFAQMFRSSEIDEMIADGYEITALTKFFGSRIFQIIGITVGILALIAGIILLPLGIVICAKASRAKRILENPNIEVKETSQKSMSYHSDISNNSNPAGIEKEQPKSSVSKLMNYNRKDDD